MPVCQQGCNNQSDHFVLAHNDFFDFRPDGHDSRIQGRQVSTLLKNLFFHNYAF
jgi:hypothetical protein